MNKWERSDYDDHYGYDCMTGGISIGPAMLDGARYGQESCRPITPEQKAAMERDARIIEAAPGAIDVCKKVLMLFCKTDQPTLEEIRQVYFDCKEVVETAEPRREEAAQR